MYRAAQRPSQSGEYCCAPSSARSSTRDASSSSDESLFVWYRTTHVFLCWISLTLSYITRQLVQDARDSSITFQYIIWTNFIKLCRLFFIIIKCDVPLSNSVDCAYVVDNHLLGRIKWVLNEGLLQFLLMLQSFFRNLLGSTFKEFRDSYISQPVNLFRYSKVSRKKNNLQMYSLDCVGR